MTNKDFSNVVLFSLDEHGMHDSLAKKMNIEIGHFDRREFPDGESYLRVQTNIIDKNCVVLADLSRPNKKYLPLIFLIETLKDLGAQSVGLITPYLSYMRQDRRFVEGEAITSKIFAQALSNHIDWLVTVDPHLHRYESLSEIYSVPNHVVQGAPALVGWLQKQEDLLLVGPDAESEQWVSEIAKRSQHEYVIGNKTRLGDRNVEIELPDLSKYKDNTAVIIDDVISSGQTILKCIEALKSQGIKRISCAAVHGVFADNSDRLLLNSGLSRLATSNTIPHPSNDIDIVPLLIEPIRSSISNLVEAEVKEISESEGL